MTKPRNYAKETLYGDIKTNVLVNVPEPETDINVKRGLTWAIGGTATGAVLALLWFVYRLFAPIEGVNQAAEGVADFIVVPTLGLLYALMGAVVGGCLGISVGIVYMAIAAYKESKESEGEEEEDRESFGSSVHRIVGGHY